VLLAARQVVEYLAIRNDGDDPFQALLRAEADRFLQADPSYSYHDDLSPWCDPQWFSDFVADAAAHGLQFLTEAEPIEMEDHLVPPEARGYLSTFGTDRIRRQQYIDHHRARRFRQTLLCRADRAPTDQPDPARLGGLLLATGPGERGTVIDLAPDAEVTFGLADSVSVSTSYPLGKAALAVLLAESPGRLAFADLDLRARDVMRNLGDGGPSDDLATFLLTMYGASFVKLHEVPTPAVGHVTERPRVGRVARWQAEHGRTLSTLNHFSLTFTDPRKLEMVALVDGTRTVGDLAAEWVARGLAEGPDAAPADDGVAEFLTVLVEQVMLDG
jgi:hypothetical protein